MTAAATVANVVRGPIQQGDEQDGAGQQQDGEGHGEGLVAGVMHRIPLLGCGHLRFRQPDGTCPPGTIRQMLPPPHARYSLRPPRPTATTHDVTVSPFPR